MNKNLKPGDIFLFKPGGDWMSQIIAWGTNSPYCHVAVCISPDMALAIEANTSGGVRAIDINKITREMDVFRVKPEFSYDLNKTIAFLVNKLNNHYDYKGVIYLGVLKALDKIGIPLKEKANRLQIGKDYFCSELCYEAFYKGGGLDIVPEVDEADITSPGDIAESSRVEKIT